jgi:hypothetical protein
MLPPSPPPRNETGLWGGQVGGPRRDARLEEIAIPKSLLQSAHETRQMHEMKTDATSPLSRPFVYFVGLFRLLQGPLRDSLQGLDGTLFLEFDIPRTGSFDLCKVPSLTVRSRRGIQAT